MPLKHHTETFFVFALGLAILVTGFILSTLPPVPLGAIPGGILLVLSVIYPLSLLSFYRENRADHVFRWLHWFPFFMILVWFLLQGLHLVFPSIGSLTGYYTWGWMSPIIGAGIFFLIIFCLSVIRRRVTRIGLLALAFIPYVALAAVNETGDHAWDKEMTALLWDQPVWHELTAAVLKVGTGSTSTGTTQIAAEIEEEMKQDEKNLEESEDPQEEQWRERLRAFEERRQRIEERLEERMAGQDSMDDAVTVSQDTGTGREYRELATAPSELPASGFGMDAFGLTMIAGYFGVLHQRARKRRT